MFLSFDNNNDIPTRAHCGYYHFGLSEFSFLPLPDMICIP